MHQYIHKLVSPFCPMGRFFTNPHHLSGTIAARLATNFATLLWATIVLVVPNALMSSGARYAFITEYVSENVLGGVLGVLAASQLVCLWRHTTPRICQNLGYAVMSVWWGFVFFIQIFRDGPIQATSTSLSAMAAVVALYAFLDGHLPPPRTCDVDDSA